MAEKLTVEAWAERYRLVAAGSGLAEVDPLTSEQIERLMRLQIAPAHAVAFLVDLEREILEGARVVMPRDGGLLGTR